MNKHNPLTRREFLKFLTAGAVLTAGRPLHLLAQDGAEIVLPEFINVPPSLMLHSRHRWKLPEMLEYLAEAGFQGITYKDLELALLGDVTLPENPILISIDDLSPVRGNPSHSYFAAMKETLVEYGFKGTFALYHKPDESPDEAAWEQIAAWVEDGIAIESHSSYHSNLDRYNLTERDYQIEIVESARVIEERTGQAVRALMTPYGSGYDRETGQLNEKVIATMKEANIRFMVGILDGRDPIPTDIALDEVIYLGRVGPGLTDDANGALYEMTHW